MAYAGIHYTVRTGHRKGVRKFIWTFRILYLHWYDVELHFYHVWFLEIHFLERMFSEIGFLEEEFSGDMKSIGYASWSVE